MSATLFHRRYLSLVDEIERRFPVAAWKAADLDIWPLARMDLYLEVCKVSVGLMRPPSQALPLRALERYAGSCLTLWRSRHDLEHRVARPRRSDAVLLGDGLSLDCIDGAWRDRYGDPVIAALERRGLSTFLMQMGDLRRLPWHRPTYAASLIAHRGYRRARSLTVAAQLPQLSDFCRFLADHGLPTTSCSAAALEARARVVLAVAAECERLLRVVQPSLAFVVTYYAGLGPPFLLACRRLGILSVDLQHCPQDGAHKAYGWSAVPTNGYGVLPSVFWHWTGGDAAYVQRWTETLPQPWHRPIQGGNLQLTPYLDDDDPGTQAFDARFATIAGRRAFQRDILVALQPVSGYRAQWEALAAHIRVSPPDWRWWIRRHPAARDFQDAEYRSLVSLRLPNVIVDECLSLPLPALLRHMSVLISRNSGAASEAACFGVPSLYLSDEAREQFALQLKCGTAKVVALHDLQLTIQALPRRSPRPMPPVPAPPPLDDTLSQLMRWSGGYRELCQRSLQERLASRRNVSESCISSA